MTQKPPSNKKKGGGKEEEEGKKVQIKATERQTDRPREKKERENKQKIGLGSFNCIGHITAKREGERRKKRQNERKKISYIFNSMYLMPCQPWSYQGKTQFIKLQVKSDSLFITTVCLKQTGERK